jgi:hypothetical protein
MLRRVAPEKNYVSEERITSIIWVQRIRELGTTLASTISCDEFLRNRTRATRGHIPEDGSLHFLSKSVFHSVRLEANSHQRSLSCLSLVVHVANKPLHLYQNHYQADCCVCRELNAT